MIAPTDLQEMAEKLHQLHYNATCMVGCGCKSICEECAASGATLALAIRIAEAIKANEAEFRAFYRETMGVDLDQS